MITSLSSPDTKGPTAAERHLIDRSQPAAWLLAIAGLWVWIFHHLAVAWQTCPNYQYGYAVPWAALFLCWRRFRHLGEPSPVTHRLLPGAVIVGAWGSFLLAELWWQVQPQGRLVGWLMTASATLLTAAWLYRRGGRPLLRRFAFPLAFAWMAVQWPAQFEYFITLKLKALVTGATTAALSATGFFAVQRGNVIELATGSVGVETACSGVTSFQSSLMVTLFLGEFFRLRRGWRVLLVAAGTLIALAANCARVYSLSVLVDGSGEAAVEKYHDLLGNTETILILVAIYLAARWMSGVEQPTPPASTSAAWTSLIAAGPGSLRHGWVAVLTFAAVPFIAAGWFGAIRSVPPGTTESPRWSLQREGRPAIREVPITPDERRTLGFTTGEAIACPDAAQGHTTLYHFFWKSDEPAIGPYVHTPDICMTLAGWTQVGSPTAATLRVRETEFAARVYRFRRDGEELTAFETIWFGGRVQNDLTRLGMMWRSPRGSGMEVLKLFLPAQSDRTAQIRSAEAFLTEVLSPRAQP